MACLFIMIVMVTSFVSSLEFTFDSPDEVEIGEEFDVLISANTNEIYDVKIFVWKEEKSNTISEIFKDGEWKSPFHYLQDVFPEETNFRKKVLEGEGTREICVRMRVADTGGFDEVCQPILVLEDSEDEGEENSDEDEESEEEDSGEEENDEESSQEEDSDDEFDEDDESEENSEDESDEEENMEEFSQEQEGNELQSKTTGKIVLNSPEKRNENKEFVSSEKKVRIGVVYGFLILCVFLIILLSLRRL